MKTLILTLFAVLFSSCALFENITQNETNSITICDSVKTDLKVPVSIPNVPLVNITTQKSGAGIYLHWCYEVKADSNLTQIIKYVSDIVLQVLKIINQLNIK